MDLSAATIRHAALVRELEAHEYRYYVLDDPVVSDEAFDRLMHEVYVLEEAHPSLVTSTSPTQRVTGAPREGVTKVAHTMPMFSLDNVYTPEELEAFVDRMRERLPAGEELRFCAEPKLDGASVEVLYRNGQLMQASTRGDGVLGEEITANVRTIRGVPLAIPYTGEVTLRGEVLLLRAALPALNASRVAQGLEPFANARNAAAGSIRVLDPQATRVRPLRILFYQCLEGPSLHATHSETLAWLASLGVPTPRTFRVVAREGLVEALAAFAQERAHYAFDTDGVVVKLDRYPHQASLGSTAKAPRWAVAYKFQAEQAVTHVRAMRVQVGRSGVLTPVAVLDPVHLGGTTITRASLHNTAYLQALDLCLGDRVWVAKAGEVIPQVVSVDPLARTGAPERFVMPTACPACQTPVVSKLRVEDRPEQGWEAALRCPNPLCPGQIRAQIHHFSRRAAMNIEHLGVALIAQLIGRELLHDVADLYTLELSALLPLERMAQKSAERVLQSIHTSRTRSLDRLLAGVGIPQLGQVASRQLAEAAGTLDALLAWTPAQTMEQLSAVHGFGGKMIESVVSFLQNPVTRGLLEKLHRLGVGMPQLVTPQRQEGPLAGQSFCVTGVFSRSREEIHRVLREGGGEIHETVKKTTTFLVTGEKTGSSKLVQARKHGTCLLDEAALHALL